VLDERTGEGVSDRLAVLAHDSGYAGGQLRCDGDSNVAQAASRSFGSGG
jgi:hypothetical protein